MKRVIVTGATGMIGSTLIKLLVKNNIEVLALIRPNSKRKNNILNKKIKVIECSLENMKNLEGLGKYDAFYHLGWDKTFGECRDDVEIQFKNIEYTLDAVRLAKRCGCKIFVGVGSQAEYGIAQGKIGPNTPVNPQSGYGIAKYSAGRMSGLLCDQFNMKHCWVRILSVYGKGDASHTLISYCIECFLKENKPSLTMCEQIWDYLYSEDAARALYLIGKKGKHNAIYCLGSGEEKSLKDYVKIIRDKINPQLEIGFGEKEYYKNQPMYLSADINNLINDTGFYPRVSFEEGISNTIRYHKNINQRISS